MDLAEGGLCSFAQQWNKHRAGYDLKRFEISPVLICKNPRTDVQWRLDRGPNE